MSVRQLLRSPSFKVFSSHHYEVLADDLIFVFNGVAQKKFKIINKELIDDINVSMEAIREIEAHLREAHYSQTHRSFPQHAIDELNLVLQKVPLYIGAGFDQYASPTRAKHGSTLSKRLKNIRLKVEKLHNRKRLSDLRLFPFVPQWGEDKINDRTLRYRLTLGIFDYLQRLAINRVMRPKCCVVCGNWFLASKTNAKTCGSKCRDRKFATSPRGRMRRRINTRNYRERLKSVTVVKDND